ncbi:DUF3857 domain-containing protein [Amphritea sp.]|uniref:DUF3857 domain-containing protein n=1 Tax=Amphritea sp. TaxID=1872502 RepID=UPI003D13A806
MKTKKQLWLKIFFTYVGMLFANACWANSDINTAPSPNWVTPVSLPSTSNFPQDQIQNGIYYLLLDTQVKVNQGQQPQYHHHRADYIVNQMGVTESSQLNMNYDPSYQSFKLHDLHIIRDAVVIDKIHTARIKQIQREEESDDLIYNGRMTVNIILDDVRVGDIIEYSYSIQGMNPVYQNLFSFNQYLNWSVPLGRLSLRVLWNKPTPLHVQINNSNLKLAHTNTATGSEYRLQSDQIAPLIIDKNTPVWFNPWGVISLSELGSWKAVADWGQQLYQNVIIADDEIEQLVSDIKSTHEGVDAQIAAALHFVQDEVRYLGIELGQNSHRPTPAPETLRNRYGDCKDKTVLLLTLLKQLGVEAYPALVNTEAQLDKRLPSINAFDHVITYMQYKGNNYWLDPTRSYQYGGIDNIQQADFGYALVLRPATAELTQMLPLQSKYGVFVNDNFMIPAEGDVEFSSETVNYGWNAENQRQRFASTGNNQIQREYLEFFQSYYPGIQVKEAIQFKDDADYNTLRTTEQYRIMDFWQENTRQQQLEADFYGNIVSYALAIPDEPSRNHPLYLSHPEHLEQTIHLNFEEYDWSFDDQNFTEDNDLFYFQNEIHFDPAQKRLTLRYIYQTKAEYVPADKYQSYLSALKRVENHLSYGIYKSAGATVPAESNEEANYNWLVIAFIALYIALYLLVFLLWRRDRKRNPDSDAQAFFPVSIFKLTAMWVLTFGFYGFYWFYKNFRYIKEQENNASMPFVRGFFYYLWYIPLWKKLKQDSDQRFGKNHLPGTLVATCLGLLFFITVLAGNTGAFAFPSLLLSALLVLPLANYIHFINGSDSPDYRKHSRWCVRHYLLVVLSLPLCSLPIGGQMGFIPSEAVIKGSQLMNFNIKLMQRRGVLQPGDEIEYFYSDAFLFISEDGNGFTQRHVFSYWKNENDLFEQQQASYDEIADIQVQWEKGFTGNTTVTIVRKDGTSFVLYVSTSDHKDRVFVNALLRNWNTASSDSG